ncbi:MAG: glutamate-5-semialdehyde dehydrogenase [Alphaproteobacteria bacterium]|nr:glutamate-5-semialdehyde dehydrogenase [Alphaproteobacteria bacterium]
MKAAASLPEQNIPSVMRAMGKTARAAYMRLSEARNEQKDMALVGAAMSLRERVAEILSANERDIAYAREHEVRGAMLDRLLLTPERIEGMAQALETVATLPDPVNRIVDEWERPNGLVIQRVSIPLGVIGIIYEARPNVTADAAALCIKSGNACILRGGSESLHSSEAIVSCIRQGLQDAGLPESAVQMVPVRDREAVTEMLGMTGIIDVIIPRGGKSLCEKVQRESRVPTLLHLDGNCHTYIHAKADAQLARDVLLNAKMRRTGICGATESLLIDEAAIFMLPGLIAPLIEKGCELRGDERARAADKRIRAATEEDWSKEYLDAVLSIKTVSGLQAAIEHINAYGSHHTDAIITEDNSAARAFLRQVDSAIVMHNASTQFADGGEFGFGAEIGIATGRLHARGPVGAEQLTTYKYVVHGTGQVRT